MHKPVIVYALVDMRASSRGAIFYVGMGVRKRPLQHLRDSKSARGHSNFRVQDVLVAHAAEGCEPEILVLDECDDHVQATELERGYIAKFGRQGVEAGGILMNIAPGYVNFPPDFDEVRAAIGVGTKLQNARLWADLEHRARRILAMKGKKKARSAEATAARIKNLALARTPEAREALCRAMLDRWTDPAYRAKRSRNQAAAWTDPEKRENMLAGRSEGVAQSWEDPGVRARRIAGVSAAVTEKWANDPDFAERTRAGHRAAWADPEKKAERVAKMLETRRAKAAERQQTSDPSAAAVRSANMTALNAARTTEERSAAQARTWNDPTVRERRAAGIKAAAQDPALKAARLAAMLAGKRRKAAERAAAAGEREEHQAIETCGAPPT